MREEYDFSTGRRNPYAERLAGQPLSTPITRGEQSPACVVEIFRDASERFRWRVRLPAGETLAVSTHAYETSESCREAVDVFLRVASGPASIHAA